MTTVFSMRAGYQKILVAVDRSPQSDAVFEQAVRLAEQDTARLMVLHCLPFADHDSYSDLFGNNMSNFSRTMQAELEQDVNGVQQWFAEYRDRTANSDLSIEWVWKFGDAGRCVCRQAHAWNADLIILGRRGRRGITEIILGSVSNYVLHHASCSVLVVQGV